MTTNQDYIFEDYFIDKPQKAIHYFWLGFIINTVSYTLMIITNSPSKIFILLQFIGIVIFVLPAIQLIRLKIENKYLASLYVIYFIWSFVIVARGFSLNKDYLINLVVDSSGGIFLYLAPLILLFPRNLAFIATIFNAIIILSIFFLLFLFIFSGDLIGEDSENGQRIIEYFAKILSIPAGFILLTNTYQSSKRNLFSIVIILLTFSLAVIRARRGLMFMSLNIIAFSFVFYFFTNKGNLAKRFIPLVLLPIVLLYTVQFYQDNKTDTFSNISERLDEDTRSGVVAFFVMDMSVDDWIIGKGINGEYFCPVSEESNSNYRNVIETDYLQIILKGGIVSLAILLLIAIPAVVKGLFYSNNILSKASGLWILFWLINMYPTSVTNFNINYLIVWICIGICYSPEIRRLPEDSVKEFFRSNGSKLLG